MVNYKLIIAIATTSRLSRLVRVRQLADEVWRTNELGDATEEAVALLAG
jgi:hypothetical protein